MELAHMQSHLNGDKVNVCQDHNLLVDALLGEESKSKGNDE